ncbi:MAG: choice-of-anchor D domain-containing protein, partial [Lysobacter sp.]|nr:choice-of-anchor D domain-containing protein [Lysobacter sp.]
MPRHDQGFPDSMRLALPRRMRSPGRALAALAVSLSLLPVAAGAAVAAKADVTSPAPFAFAHKTNVALGAVATSNAVAISGITVNVPVSVSGGLYSIGCSGSFTAAAGTIAPGATVCVRHVTPLALGATTSTTLTVGGVSATFNSTTSLSSPGTPPATIAAGTSHTLVITPSGEVRGWGDNTSGKLGNGNTAASTIPVRASGLTQVIAVAAGMSHSLALKADGTVWAWGLDTDGQLGNGPTAPTTCSIPGGGNAACALVPQQVQGLADVVAISAGWRHSMALRRDGTVWAWGNGFNGQSGVNGSLDAPAQVEISGVVTRIAAGYMHSVALRSDGTVLVWGRGNEGELGPDDPTGSGPTPRVVTGLGGVTDIAAGGAFTLARKGDGSLVAWGSNVYGNLGDATGQVLNTSGTPYRAAPSVVPGMTGGVAEFSAGFGFALVRKSDGTAWSWGLNNVGQLGNGGTAPDLCGRNVINVPCVRTPTRIAQHDNALRLAAGGAHGVALRPDGAFVVFGDNAWGQRGDKSPNFGEAFSQTTYDPQFTLVPAGTFGTPTGVGQPSTSGSLNLNALDNGLAFGAQGVGTTSAPLVITLSNLGDGGVDIATIAVAGTVIGTEFSKTADACQNTTLGVGASCDIALVFTPASIGSRAGTLTVNSNAANSAVTTYSLHGTGADTRVASAVSLSSSAPTSLAGTTVTLTATVSATGATPTGTAIFKDGGVTIAGCASVALSGAAASCATAALAPGAHSIVAEYSGDASVQASASGPFAQVIVATPAPVSASPPSTDFGGQSMGTSAPAAVFTLTNTGASAITVASISASTHFSVVHGCTGLAAGASCTATVTFTPATQGSLSGSLTVQTDTGIQIVPLAGTGERSLVTHYYRSILRRAPDGGGKAFWESEAARMASLGANVNETWYAMAVFFFTSPEYLGLNRDNNGFVTDLYNTFFNRPP